MILIFLGFLIVLLFMLLFSNKEGLSNECKYQYLSPNQTNTPLDDKTINEFLLLYNDNMTKLRSDFTLNKSSYKLLLQNKIFCTEEIEYYLKNTYFPFNKYVSTELRNNTNMTFSYPYTTTTIAYTYPVRHLFKYFIAPSYRGKPQPFEFQEAQAIYNGRKQESACNNPVLPGSAVLATPAAPPSSDNSTISDSSAVNDSTYSTSFSDSETYSCNTSCNAACNNDSSFKYN